MWPKLAVILIVPLVIAAALFAVYRANRKPPPDDATWRRPPD